MGISQSVASGHIIPLPMLEYKVAGTFTPAIPANCVAIQAGVLGGGGAGTSSGNVAPGGGGGAYVEFLRSPTKGATVLTVITGAVASGNGTTGNTSSISDGTWIISCPGGQASGVGGSAPNVSNSIRYSMDLRFYSTLHRMAKVAIDLQTWQAVYPPSADSAEKEG